MQFNIDSEPGSFKHDSSLVRCLSNAETCDGSSVVTEDDTSPCSYHVPDALSSDSESVDRDNSAADVQTECMKNLVLPKAILLGFRASMPPTDDHNCSTFKMLSQAQLQSYASVLDNASEAADAGNQGNEPDEAVNIESQDGEAENQSYGLESEDADCMPIRSPPGLSRNTHHADTDLREHEDQECDGGNLQEHDSSTHFAEMPFSSLSQIVSKIGVPTHGGEPQQKNDANEAGIEVAAAIDAKQTNQLNDIAEAVESAMAAAAAQQAASIQFTHTYASQSFCHAPCPPPAAPFMDAAACHPYSPHNNDYHNSAAHYYAVATQCETFGNFLQARAAETSNSAHLLNTASEYYAAASRFARTASMLSSQADMQQAWHSQHSVLQHLMQPPGAFHANPNHRQQMIHSAMAAHQRQQDRVNVPTKGKHACTHAKPIGLQRDDNQEASSFEVTEISKKARTRGVRGGAKTKAKTSSMQASPPAESEVIEAPAAQNCQKLPSAEDFPPLAKPPSCNTGGAESLRFDADTAQVGSAWVNRVLHKPTSEKADSAVGKPIKQATIAPPSATAVQLKEDSDATAARPKEHAVEKEIAESREAALEAVAPAVKLPVEKKRADSRESASEDVAAFAETASQEMHPELVPSAKPEDGESREAALEGVAPAVKLPVEKKRADSREATSKDVAAFAETASQEIHPELIPSAKSEDGEVELKLKPTAPKEKLSAKVKSTKLYGKHQQGAVPSIQTQQGMAPSIENQQHDLGDISTKDESKVVSCVNASNSISTAAAMTKGGTKRARALALKTGTTKHAGVSDSAATLPVKSADVSETSSGDNTVAIKSFPQIDRPDILSNEDESCNGAIFVSTDVSRQQCPMKQKSRIPPKKHEVFQYSVKETNSSCAEECNHSKRVFTVLFLIVAAVVAMAFLFRQRSSPCYAPTGVTHSWSSVSPQTETGSRHFVRDVLRSCDIERARAEAVAKHLRLSLSAPPGNQQQCSS